MLDLLESTVLYCGFVVLLLWRAVSQWSTGKSWKNTVNYVTALYFMCSVLFIIEVAQVGVIQVTLKLDTHKVPTWMIVLAVVTPVSVLATLVICWLCTRAHLHQIQEGSTKAIQHDRVINIIALPAVYAVVVLGALLSVYPIVLKESQGHLNSEERQMAFAMSSTFVYVGDVYEAWALFQFGSLVSELLEESLGHTEITITPKHGERGAQPSIVVSAAALASVMWVGLTLFGIVCLSQAGYSLYVWFFDILRSPDKDTTAFHYAISQFHLAGLIASGAAIYNVWKFEDTFGEFIDGFSPFFKFFSIKIIVFFAFWQDFFLSVLQKLSILPITELQVKFLANCLMCFECLLCAALHTMAWRAEEVWYTRDKEAIDERAPLMPAATGNPFQA